MLKRYLPRVRRLGNRSEMSIPPTTMNDGASSSFLATGVVLMDDDHAVSSLKDQQDDPSLFVLHNDRRLVA